MNTKELSHYIGNIRVEYANDKAYLSFFYGDDSGDLGYIEVNKEGIMLFTADLLEASIEIDNRKFDKEELFYMPTDLISVNSEIRFDFVKFIQKKQEIEPTIDYNETWKDHLIKFFFIGVLIFILVSILVGAFTILTWMF